MAVGNVEKMTRDEFFAKYGDIEVKFSSYYKYTFIYSAPLPDGKLLRVCYGGNSEDIYRHKVKASMATTVRDLEPFYARVYDVGERIESHFDAELLITPPTRI